MSRSFYLFLVAGGMSLLPALAQSPLQQRHALNLVATGALTRTAGFTYEFLPSVRDAAFIEGDYAFGKGYTVEAGYRRHYARNTAHVGLNGPFWGPFVRWGKGNFNFKDPDEDRRYDIDVRFLNVGVNWGKRYVWKNRFNLTWRLGYGLPVYADFDWSPEKSKDSGTIEVFSRIFMGLDAELSLGLVF